MNITNMNYCEMEEKKREERRKIASCYASSNASSVASCDAGIEEESLENDCNTWYTTEEGKGRYMGEWKNGLPNGKGIKHIYKDDSYIDGNFIDGLAEGHCKQTFEQTWESMEPYYEGEFKRNEYHGEGEYHYGNGDYYKGMWKDSKYHGNGAEYSKRKNKTWVGEYENDEKVEGNWVKGEI